MKKIILLVTVLISALSGYANAYSDEKMQQRNYLEQAIQHKTLALSNSMLCQLLIIQVENPTYGTNVLWEQETARYAHVSYRGERGAMVSMTCQFDPKNKEISLIHGKSAYARGSHVKHTYEYDYAKRIIIMRHHYTDGATHEGSWSLEQAYSKDNNARH